MLTTVKHVNTSRESTFQEDCCRSSAENAIKIVYMGSMHDSYVNIFLVVKMFKNLINSELMKDESETVSYCKTCLDDHR